MIALALVACHSPARPDGASGGSSSAGAAPTRQGAPGPSAPPAVAQPAAASGSAVVPQSSRPSDSTDRLVEAEQALADAIASTKSAKTRQQACAGLAALEQKFVALDLLTPPAGLEQAFIADRDDASSMLGAIQGQDCKNDAAGAEEIGADLAVLRTALAKLRQLVADAAAAGPQPRGPTKRTRADTDRMAAADRALITAAARAKAAKTLGEACSGLAELAKKLDQLELVTPPRGFERAFSEGRNGLGMLLGVMMDERCDASSGADADLIRDNIGELRREFVALQQLGAKP